jgi:hypothetical protein
MVVLLLAEEGFPPVELQAATDGRFIIVVDNRGVLSIPTGNTLLVGLVSRPLLFEPDKFSFSLFKLFPQLKNAAFLRCDSSNEIVGIMWGS